MLIIQLKKKTDYNTKVTEIENKVNNHNHDKYIDTSEFNKLVVDNFNARIAQANLIRKADFDAKLSGITEKLLKIKQIIHLFKINYKDYKHLIQAILLVKIILKKMEHKIIQYFNQ